MVMYHTYNLIKPQMDSRMKSLMKKNFTVSSYSTGLQSLKKASHICTTSYICTTKKCQLHRAWYISCTTLCETTAWQALLSMGFSNKNTAGGCHFLLLGIFLSSVQFSCSVVSDSLWPHGLQHTRPPCPSPTPRAYSTSWPLSQWCHPAVSSVDIPFSSCLQVFPRNGIFSNESALWIRWPKYWSFSFNISPSSEHPGLISFRMDWLDILAVTTSKAH